IDDENGIPTLKGQNGSNVVVPKYSGKITTVFKDQKFYTQVYDVFNFDKIRNLPDGNYILMNDLDFKDENFKMIPNFTGTIDGGGNTLHNLAFDVETNNAGLFGKVANAKIE